MGTLLHDNKSREKKYRFFLFFPAFSLSLTDSRWYMFSEAKKERVVASNSSRPHACRYMNLPTTLKKKKWLYMYMNIYKYYLFLSFSFETTKVI